VTWARRAYSARRPATAIAWSQRWSVAGSRGWLAEHRGDLRGSLGRVEPAQLDPHQAAALQLGDERAQRVARAQLVVAVRGDEQQPALAYAQPVHEMGDQLPGRRVRPVQVLQDHDDGRLVGEAFQEPAQSGQ
jgi:hypothetical protein